MSKRSSQKSGVTYENAGVSLNAADDLADRLSALLPTTFRKGCVSLPGGFAALFDPSKEGMQDRLLVMSTDGVGTKLKLGIQFKQYRGLGIDLVAMSVNDIATLGAEPLCFLDYMAYGKISRPIMDELIEGIVDGCKQAGCALVGGETAEMPGVYQSDDFDLAGFCLGAVERNRKVDGSLTQSGDILVGLPSSGVHSNGYSLVRAILERCDAKEVKQQSSALLEPTRIYVPQMLKAHRQFDLKGMAHITGGGLAGNVERVIPKGLLAEMKWGAWPVPSIFKWLQERGKVAQKEMLEVFNMGIGYVFVCAAKDEAPLRKLLGDEAVVIGKVIKAANTDMRAKVV